jgi:hypothetical protein
MKWDQIESKWALMTRRIRADFCDKRTDVAEGLVHTLNPRDSVSPTVADSQLSALKDRETETSAS